MIKIVEKNIYKSEINALRGLDYAGCCLYNLKSLNMCYEYQCPTSHQNSAHA